MPISPKVLRILLAQIERLQRENALLRKQAGIDAISKDSSYISAEEKKALLKKIR